MLHPDKRMGVPQLMMLLEPNVVWDHTRAYVRELGVEVESQYGRGAHSCVLLCTSVSVFLSAWLCVCVSVCVCVCVFVSTCAPLLLPCARADTWQNVRKLRAYLLSGNLSCLPVFLCVIRNWSLDSL